MARNISGGDDASEDTAAQNNPPSNLLQWMELLVTDMMNVSDVDDAEDCASRALKLLKTIASHEGVQTAEISRQKRSTAASASHSACSNDVTSQAVASTSKQIDLDRMTSEDLGKAEPDVPHSISVTLEEAAAIERLDAMGFDSIHAIEAFLSCNRNEELAASYLLENADPED